MKSSLALAALFALVPNSGQAQTRVSFSSKDGTKLSAVFQKAPDAKALLLVVHGLQSHAGWFLSGERFASEGITTLAYDRRGSGKSEGMRGYAKDEDDFLEDFDAAFRYLRAKNPKNLPVHVMANSLGALATLHYATTHQNDLSSIVLTTPGTHSSNEADFSLGEKVSILFSSAKRYFSTPLEDEHFVSSGPWLQWIKDDTLGGRQFTASFFRSANKLRDLDTPLRKLRVPLLLMLARQDAAIDNEKVIDKVYDRYRGPKVLREFDSEHYLFFGRDADRVTNEIIDWVIERSEE